MSFLCDNDKNFGVIVTKVNDFCPTCKNEAARVRLQREIAAEEERRARIEERRQAERKRKSEELEGSDHDNSKKWKDKGKGKVEETIGNGPALLRRSPRIAIRDKNGNNVNIADLISPKPSEKKARLE